MNKNNIEKEKMNSYEYILNIYNKKLNLEYIEDRNELKDYIFSLQNKLDDSLEVLSYYDNVNFVKSRKSYILNTRYKYIITKNLFKVKLTNMEFHCLLVLSDNLFHNLYEFDSTYIGTHSAICRLRKKLNINVENRFGYGYILKDPLYLDY